MILGARKDQSKQLLTCFCGIFFCYLVFGFAQEKVTRGNYGGERFTFSQALVFVQCIFNAIFAKAITTFFTKPVADKTPYLLYSSCALCYMGAMVASNHALMYVTYPKQVLGKSCKPIPVMILGVLFAHKRYPLAKYLCILMIVLGVAGFMYKDKDDGTPADDKEHFFYFGLGEIMLLLSLTLDGFTGVTQERMRAKYATNQHHMMYNVNLWSCFILGAGLIVSGQGLQFAGFVTAHPEVIKYLLLFSLTSALGQHFIFVTVVTFGPLTTSVITTTRKFFTILFSVLIFQNPMNTRQWISTLLVFTGLALDAIYGKSLKTPAKKEAS